MFGNKEAKKAGEMRTQILERLEKQGSVLSNFSVEFDDGVVTLAGDCDTEKTRDKAVLMAKGIDGVKDVKDGGLRVLQAAAPAPAPTPAPARAPVSHPLGAAAGSAAQAATRAAAPQPIPQAAPAAQPPAQPQPDALAETIYTVQAGDNLSKIAKQFYGNANKYMVIFEANRDILKDPDKIGIGQKLRIPAQS